MLAEVFLPTYFVRRLDGDAHDELRDMFREPGTKALTFSRDILADLSIRRVVLVHAKASKSFRRYSASAVQEVCAQAQKNMALFFYLLLPKTREF
ncbi:MULTISPECIES: hypothetical protein [unclassified Bradyrhizobium]|uniref:hypothetical protein n=1 Tax=unclassified Bradyrhizobium TaxID=2631580 RepID=UPI0033965DD7